MSHPNHSGLSETFRLASCYDAPTFVKNASVSDFDAEELNGQSYSGKYLDPTHRRYPVHTKVATWTSAAQYYERSALENSKDWGIEESLEKIAAFHGILHDIKSLKKQVQDRVKSGSHSLTDEDYALVREDDGVRQRMYPLRDAVDVKTAEHYLMEHIDDFPYIERQQYARNILKKAEEFGVTFENEEEVLKIAGQRGSSSATVAKALLERAAIAKIEGEELEGIQKLAAEVSKAPSISSHDQTATNLAVFIEGFDRRHKLNRRYKMGMARPEDVVYSVPVEKMRQVKRALAQETKTGNVYNSTLFQKIALEDLDRIRPGLSSQLDWGGVRVDTEKLAAAIPRFSHEECLELDRLCHKYDIVPDFRRDIPETAVRPGDRLPDLEKAAASYTPPKRVAEPGSLLWAMQNAKRKT